MKEKKQFWSCGGGTQSCAIAALIVSGRLPKPDLAAMADTGFERRRTFEYAEEVLIPALRGVGVELEIVRRKEWACDWANGVFASSGDLLIPAFTDEGGEVGKLPTFCSKAWKQEPLERWAKGKHGLKRSDYVKWIGFSYDEPRRVNRMRDGDEWQKGLIRFPLVDDVLTNRRQAIALVKEMGWPEPPRSNCWMCPNQGDHEWRELKAKFPDEFQRAIEFEREIRLKDPNAFLHRSGVTLDLVDFSQPEDLFTRACDSGMCFV